MLGYALVVNINILCMMASRAILQKKKCLLDSVKRPHYLAQRFVCNDHGRLLDAPDAQRGNWPVIFSHSDNSEKEDSHFLTRRMAQRTLPKKCAAHYFSKVPSFHREIAVPGEVNPLGLRWTIEYVRHLSTAPAGKPELDGVDNIKESVKPKKEPSPEECDQAVEGLSSVKAKAKAKAKQLKDSSKGVKFILKKMRAILLGIGPALRAIASMSR